MVVPHPRFYWGETGNVMVRPLFTLPIPASRKTVPTRYNFVPPKIRMAGAGRCTFRRPGWRC